MVNYFVMKSHTEAIGRIVSYAASIGHEYNGWTESNGTQFVSLYGHGISITIACWSDQDYFTAVSARRVSNVEGLTADQGVAYVEAEEFVRELAIDVDKPEIRVEPIIETVQSDAIEYLDGIRAKSLLFVYEDRFTMSNFDKIIRATDRESRKAFQEVVDKFELELDPDDEAVNQTDTEPTQTAFQ